MLLRAVGGGTAEPPLERPNPPSTQNPTTLWGTRRQREREFNDCKNPDPEIPRDQKTFTLAAPPLEFLLFCTLQPAPCWATFEVECKIELAPSSALEPRAPQHCPASSEWDQQVFEVSGAATTMLRGCPIATKHSLLCFKSNGEGILNCSCLATIIASTKGSGCQDAK